MQQRDEDVWLSGIISGIGYVSGGEAWAIGPALHGDATGCRSVRWWGGWEVRASFGLCNVISKTEVYRSTVFGGTTNK